MTRARRPDDWRRDVDASRAVEQLVGAALRSHPQISRFSDFTAEHDDLDFRFRFDSADTRVDVKEKRSRLSSEIREMWPEVPERELFVVDETCFRTLLWQEGLGYLLARDVPGSRWHVFGPWELALGPRRRFERRGDKGAGEFLKGKLLFDFRNAAATTAELSVDVLLEVVRETRRALRQVRAVSIRGRDVLPVIPRAAQSEPATLSPPAAVPVEGDPAWAGLDVGLVAKIVEKLGWDAPTPVQRAAFPPILQGQNVVVLAPTAGGKTEAALLPLLDVQRREGWGRPSILCISPLKALLDDQLGRYRTLAALTDATAFAWHGDVGRDERLGFRDSPTDVLLTTPESLEGLLSRPGDTKALLGRLQAVIVDEVHSFAGTPRGAQLASLLERLDRVVEADLQRVGLSATVGNPDDVLAWLAGGSLRDRSIADAGAPMRGEDLELFACRSIDEVTDVVREAVADARAIVFTTSRRRAEQVGNALAVPVHHSSLSAEQRDKAIAALREGFAPCVVATASLEMGIDIGDVELVVQDGAPSSPGSYLQRLGRAGRRSGVRRMVFTVSTPDELLLVLAVLARARRGDVGAIPPGRGARLVLGQQALALAFQQTVPRRSELYEALRWSPAFRHCIDDVEPTVEHLLTHGWLTEAGDQIVVGPKAHERFGGRGFVDLMATFEAVAGVRIVDEAGKSIGSLDWARVVDAAGDVREGGVVLAGKSWELVSVDRFAGTAMVRPGESGRAPSWRGPAVEVERPTWEAAREVLRATDVPLAMDERGQAWLERLRRGWVPKLDQPLEKAGDATLVHSFAGGRVHRAVLAAIGMDGTADGPTLSIDGSLEAVSAAAARALDRFDDIVEREAERQVTALSSRHVDLSASSVLLAEARQFHVDTEGIRAVLELLAGG
jgi:ATP-dependent Lhr-like helicase